MKFNGTTGWETSASFFFPLVLSLSLKKCIENLNTGIWLKQRCVNKSYSMGCKLRVCKLTRNVGGNPCLVIGLAGEGVWCAQPEQQRQISQKWLISNYFPIINLPFNSSYPSHLFIIWIFLSCIDCKQVACNHACMIVATLPLKKNFDAFPNNLRLGDGFPYCIPDWIYFAVHPWETLSGNCIAW